MTKEKKNAMLHCLEEHRPGKWKIRTKLFVVILIMLAVSILLFWGLWNLQESVCHVFENLHLISWFDEDTYIEQIKEDAVNYNVPELESDKTAQKAFRPFLKKHTSYYIGCYIYGHDDGLFRAGHAAKVIEKIMYGSIISDSMDILGEYTNIVPVQFANGTYDVVYSSIMRTRFVYPYVIASALFSIFIFFLGVLSYMGSVIKRMDGLKDAVVNMSQGDLTHAIPQCGEDEVGIVAKELDILRKTLDENIKQEDAIRQTNQELISAISHDLRTPLTVLNGYLEVLRMDNADEEKRALYLNKCLQKTADIKALTDHMFEYAFAYETNEEAVLKRMEIGQVKEILLGNCEFVELAGFTIEGQMEDIEGIMYADEMMLKRMSSNLFSNILKYADKGKPIYVRLRVEQGMLGILLINTIKQDVGTVESNHIGLRSSQKMVELHKGQMHVYHEKQQFRVHILLPVISISTPQS